MTTRGALGHELVANMERMTADRIGGQSIENARRNHAYIDRGQSLSALRDLTIGEDDSAIVIAAGPSLRKMNPAAQIKATNYKGAIVAADSALAYCLQHDIVPDLVVTLDPHASRIVRWFGDPELSADSISADDYFARQDMDKAFSDELRFNQEVLRLVDDHAPQIRIALSTSASKAVADRVIESGMQVFWWNPMLDDPDLPNSATRELYELNKLPCVNAGGNVGAACWMLAHAALRKNHVALTGVDFSYYAETPYQQTQYYREALALVGEENLDSLFIHIHNPYLDADFYTDPAYMWYRENLLEMVLDVDVKTYNCTEGGILFGDGIEFTPLSEFLQSRK